MFLGIGPCLVAQAAQRRRCYVSKRYRAVAVDLLLFGENSRRRQRQIRTANGGVA